MAVRNFDGIDDSLDFPYVNKNAPVTFAVLMKTTAGSQWHSPIQAQAANSPIWGILIESDNSLSFNDSNNTSTSTIDVLTTDGWCIVVGEHDGGNATDFSRLHKYVLSTGTWSHSDGNDRGDLDVSTSTGASGTIRLGNLTGNGFLLKGRIAAVAVWSVKLTDAEVEALATNLATQDWFDMQSASLELLADLNQASTATAVPDLSGHSRDQSGITGTDVVTTDDPPGWTFGVGAGGTTFNQTLTYTAAGSYAEATVLTLLRTLAYAAGAGYARLAAVTKELDYDAAASYTRATSVAKALAYTAGSSYGRRTAVTKAVEYTAAGAAELATALSAQMTLTYTATGAASVAKRAEKTLGYVASAATQLIAPQSFAAALDYAASAAYTIGATVGLPEPLLRYPRNLRAHIRPPAGIRRRRKIR